MLIVDNGRVVGRLALQLLEEQARRDQVLIAAERGRMLAVHPGGDHQLVDAPIGAAEPDQ